MNMRNQNLFAVCMMLLFGGAMFAVMPAAAEPYGAECPVESPATDTTCEVISGPGSLRIKGVGSVGLSFCQVDSQLLPFFCDAPVGTVGGSGAGGAAFPPMAAAYGFVTSDPTPQNVSVWIEYQLSPLVPCIDPTCGFTALLCNDRDYNGACTNVGNDNDQLKNDESNMALDETCEDKKDKGWKDCTDPLDVEVTICSLPNLITTGPNATWAPGQWVAFIGNWVSAAPVGPNTGTGISAGDYEVWFRNNGDCVPPECDNRVDDDGDFAADSFDADCFDDDGFYDPNRDETGPDVAEEEPLVCEATRTVLVNNTTGAVEDVLTGSCLQPDGSITGATAFTGVAFDAVRMVVFFRNELGANDGVDDAGGCDGTRTVMVTASAVGDGDTLTEVFCGGDLLVDAEAFGPNGADWDADQKTFDDYVCKVTFSWGGDLPFQGVGTCSDDP